MCAKTPLGLIASMLGDRTSASNGLRSTGIGLDEMKITVETFTNADTTGRGLAETVYFSKAL
jgi:hypothetical protein